MLFGLAFGSIAAAEDVITSDSYFYGESPPVYPSRMSTLASFPTSYLLTRE